MHHDELASLSELLQDLAMDGAVTPAQFASLSACLSLGYEESWAIKKCNDYKCHYLEIGKQLAPRPVCDSCG